MGNDIIHSDPAFSAMTIDILNNMLSKADHPGRLAEYLTGEIRELTGARCVLLIQCLENDHGVIDVNPARLRDWAESDEARHLYELAHNLTDVQLLNPESPPDTHPEVFTLLLRQGYDISIIIPLRVGPAPVGAMLLLGLPGEQHIQTEVALLRTLSGVLALVLRNALLYEDQEKAIEERTKELSLYGFTMENMGDAVYWVNPDSTFQKINSSACKMLGYSRPELFDLCLTDISLEVSEETWPGYWEKFKETQGINFETVFLAKNGKEIPVEISANYFEFEGKAYNCVIARDISTRKQLETRLHQAQKMESIGNLAGGIAHDFNNILFPILGMSELLLEDLPPKSLDHENVQEIFKAGKRGSDLVKQILSFSRRGEGRVIHVKPQGVLKEVLKLTRSFIPSNIEITHDIQEDCGFIQADPTRLHQIGMNLITNAYHAVQKKNGRIEIILREILLERRSRDGLSILPGRYAMFKVADNGIGIRPGDMSKIFDPYFTTKEKGRGTGLGLSVVYGIVKEYHGDIKVYSEPDQGTTFTLYLPLVKNRVGGSMPEASGATPSGSESILLVDDDAAVARLETQMLKRLGYRVTTHCDSLDALNTFEADPFAYDLVITDMTMPKMTGDQLAEKILAVRSEIPVVICTGFSETVGKEQAESKGIKGFLMKPVIKSDLAKKVREVLDDAKS